MKEFKKITFYGKDFTKLREAKYSEYSLDGPKTKKPINKEEDLECRQFLHNLLEVFCDNYKMEGNPSKKVTLRYPQNRDLFFRNVGVFHSKKFPFNGKEYDVTLEISCRFDDTDNTDNTNGEKAFFLAAMLLSQSPGALEQIPDKANITFHQVMDIFLLFTYAKQLAEAAKKGIFRKYRRFENNDSRPHGTIDIARHIRENMGLKNGRIAYHYRELTANNPVNRLILAAYRRLREKYPLSCEEHIDSDESVCATLRMLQTELGYSKTSVRDIVRENLRPVMHPYFSEYEDLRKTCLKILRDENVWIFDADDCSDETESLYLNVTRLWEKFLESRLKEQLAKRKDCFSLSLEAQVSKQIFVERNGTCRPDFVLWQEGQARAILDAKFKPAWDKFFSGDDSADIDDDTNKCIRDMAVFQAPRTGVIFPGDGSCNVPHKELHIGAHVFDMVRVPVPKEEEPDFKAWYNEKLLPAVDLVLEQYLAKAQQSAADEAKSEMTSKQTQA